MQIARLSPVHREYVPTLGPVTYAVERSFAAATENVDLDARANVLATVLEVPGREGDRRRLPQRHRIGDRHRDGQRQSPLLPLERRQHERDGSQHRRHRVGPLCRRSLDLGRLDVARIARAAVNKAIQSRNPRPIEPGVYPVILEAQAVADLMGFLTGAFDARTADEGRSAFSAKDGKTRVGERLFNERLNLYTDPMHPEMPATPATAEGVPATRLSLVKGGVVEHLVSSRYWAAQQKHEASPGPVNYIMESTAAPVPLDKMIESMERGLVIPGSGTCG